MGAVFEDFGSYLVQLYHYRKGAFGRCFALDKFRFYLLCSKMVVFFNHASPEFLPKKLEPKPRLFRWMLLLEEFDFAIRLQSEEASSQPLELVRDSLLTPPHDFLHEQLFHVHDVIHWFVDMVMLCLHILLKHRLIISLRVNPNIMCWMILSYGDFVVTK